jgi:hypothetical protein
VKLQRTGATVRVIFAALSMMAFGSPARADAGADIKALEERFVAALKAKDLDAIMKVYAPDQTFEDLPPKRGSDDAPLYPLPPLAGGRG